MLISSVLTVKFLSLVARDMIINLNTSKRVASSLFTLGKSYLFDDHQKNQHALRKQPNDTVRSAEYLVHNWLDALFARAQMILLWHDRTSSCFILAVFLISFRLFTQYAPRFYATVLIFILMYNLTKVWFKHIWPEIRVPPTHEDESRLDIDRFTHLHPQLMTFNELVDWIKNLNNSSKIHLEKMASMRRERPTMFCVGVCLVLSCTAYLGSRVQDSDLLFYLVTILVLLPGFYLHIIPNSIRDKLKKICLPATSSMLTSQSSAAQSPPLLAIPTDMTDPTSSIHHLSALCTNESDCATSDHDQPTSTSDLEKSNQPKESASNDRKQVSLFEQLRGRVSFPFVATTTYSNLIDDSPSDQVEDSPTTTTTSRLIEADPLVADQIPSNDGPTSKSIPLTSFSLQSSNTDLSSNESASLVDIDEEQQDGFVLL